MAHTPAKSLLPLVAFLLLLAGGWLPAPEARAADEEPMGILKVTASVAGAEVTIDYKDAGRVPVTRYLPPGPHTVRVAADGYDPWVRRVRIDPNVTTEVTARLLPGGGTVEFHATPPGALVFIDGQEVGPAPIRLTNLPPGEHAWRIEAPRHEPAEGRFTFRAGANLLVVRDLEPSAGRFVIRSNPEGAMAWIDGQPVGRTPVELRDVPPGRHSVRIQLPDHAVVVRRVDTSDGSKGVVEAELRESGALLDVRTGRPDATVRLGGEPLGTGERVRVVVDRGHFELRVEAPGMQPASAEVVVPDEGRVAWRARLAPEGADHPSTLRPVPPWYRNLVVWAGVGGGAAGAGLVGTAAWWLLAPEPPPEGDVVVVMP